MPRWLFTRLSVLIFFPIFAAFSAQIWPIATDRPVPQELDGDLLKVALVALPLSIAYAILFAVTIHMTRLGADAPLASNSPRPGVLHNLDDVGHKDGPEVCTFR